MCSNLTLQAGAVTQSELKKQQSVPQSKLNGLNSNISSLENQKDEVEEEAEEIDQELVDLLGIMDILEAELADKEAQIAQAEIDYQAAKDTEEKQYESMKQRIKFMYEKGDEQYLELFLQSKSISEMVNKAGYAQKLYDYDRTMLINYQEIKDQVKELKEQLDIEKSEMEAMQGEYEAQQKELETMLEEKRSAIEDFDSKLANARTQAKQYQAQIKAQNEQIQKLAAAEKAAREKAAKAAKEKAERAAKENASSPGTNNGGYANEDAGDSGGNGGGSSGGSATGQAIADYACKFIGNPYVAGGTSLTGGTDCSGFTMSVYSHFGYSIPRTSYSQLVYGRSISYSEAQPGDIMCYAGHVGIYIGNGNIVHASTPATGIKITPATYRQILSVRRII
jgi:cell wall-associated NlpC family hydrolase